MENDNFNNVLQNLKTIYSNYSDKKENLNPEVKIGEEDFEKLTFFEKDIIQILGDFLQTVQEGKPINYNYLASFFEKMSKSRGDLEKEYLMCLLFPEKVRGTISVIPLPTPTFTFTQRFTHYIKLNSHGAFLAQVVVPIMLEDTVPNTKISNLYINTSEALTGQDLDPNLNNYLPINTRVIPEAFGSCTLQSCKVTAKYVGNRELNSSGLFGASFSLNPISKKVVDVNASIFENINNGMNPLLSHVLDGLSVIYYPTDYTNLNLMMLNDDGNKDKISMSHRLNVYGISLPPSSDNNKSIGVVLSLNMVWNVIPTPRYADLLPVDYTLNDQNLSLFDLAKFIPSSGLATFKISEIPLIERMINLPSHIRKQAVNDLSMRGNSISTRITILDILNPLISPGISPSMTIDPKVFLNQQFIKRRHLIKKYIDKSLDLNNVISYTRNNK